MKSELNSKDYVTFARRFVKETVETMDYQELKSIMKLIKVFVETMVQS